MTPESGQMLSHYRLVEKIGEGGMGVVWKAEDTVLTRTVAIKVLPADVSRDEERRQMFLEEARLASSISDARIVQVFEFGHEGDLDFIVMEFLEGRPLNKILHGRPMPPHKVADYGHQVARALAKAHRKGLLHRDLKPGNILVTPEGEVKVVDFGLATLFTRRDTALAAGATGFSEASTKTAQTEQQRGIAGTLPYMSPEQVRGEKLDSRSDIFSLGAVLYEMTTGQRPFRGGTELEMARVIESARHVPAHEIASKVPFELERILQKCLARRPGDRYQTMEDLSVDLKHLGKAMESGSSASYHDLVVKAPRASYSLVPWWILTATVIVALAVAGLWYFTTKGKAEPIRSIAVLPFNSVGVDPELEYLSSGITDTIISSLARISPDQLRVTARSTVERFRGQIEDLSQLGQELGVGAVLTGSVARRGQGLIVRAELVDIMSGWQLWGNRYESTLGDILALEEDIASQITRGLRLELTGEQEQALSKRNTESVEAHRLYLKGRYQLRKYVHASDKAMESFRRALEIDPAYALAYTGLAEAHWHTANISSEPSEAFKKARAAVEKALEIDPDLAEARYMSANISAGNDWDWQAAEEAYAKAITLKPGEAGFHASCGGFLLLGPRDRDKALEHLDMARSLDPLSPQTLLFNLWPYYYVPEESRNFQRVLDGVVEILEFDPENYSAITLKAHIELVSGRTSQAIKSYQLVHSKAGVPITRANLAHGMAVSGQKEQAREVLKEFLESRDSGDWVGAMAIAEVYAGLGQGDDVMEWLERAYEERDENLLYSILDPRFDRYRYDPRFISLDRRIASGSTGGPEKYPSTPATPTVMKPRAREESPTRGG